MRTLGIDLSADDRRTAACAVDWREGGADVGEPEAGLDDAALRARVTAELDRGGWVGIDAPFSWPVGFRAALADHDRDGGWAADWRDRRHQFRVTDLVTAAGGRRPLSVSTNLIGVTAMRAARLLQDVGEAGGRRLDIAGADRVVEVYPAGSLVAWGGRAAGLDPQGYKAGPLAAGRRRALTAALCDRPWLRAGAAARAACERSDHALDALIAALATRAAACGLTRIPETDAERWLAPREGWIHVPVPGSLDALPTAMPATPAAADLVVRAVTAADRPRLAALAERLWGGPTVAGRGTVFAPLDLDGLVAERAGALAGLLTFRVESDALEVVTIDAWPAGTGTGSALLDAAAAAARARRCRRLVLMTTNDNLGALRFYQRRGFRLVALRPGGVDEARARKPQIPRTGDFGIPMHDELELERAV